MKILVLLFALSSICLAEISLDIKNLNLEYLEFEADKKTLGDFKRKVEAGDDITAVVNEYVDDLFKNIGTLMVKDNIDPLSLSDVEDEFLASSITLTNGHLNGVSVIERGGDVMLNYNSDTKILDAHFPVEFTNLNFTYDYHVIILLIGPKGTLVGKIKDFEVNFEVQFDFNTYHMAIKEIRTTNKGHLSVTIHGNAVVDVVINLLSEFAMTILQPWVGAEIEKFISNVADTLINYVNDVIDGILTPTTVSSILT